MLFRSLLDVGEGQCLVLRSGGQTALIDCGGSEANAGRLVQKHLAARNETAIDLLLLPHTGSRSALHSKGVPSLMEYYDLDGQIYTDHPQQQHLGETTLELLPVNWREEPGVFILVRQGGFTMLLMPEVSPAGQRWLLRTMPSLPENTILVLDSRQAHSPLDASFIMALSPQSVLLSNGHEPEAVPSRELLEQLEALDIPLYETRLRGTLRILVP